MNITKNWFYIIQNQNEIHIEKNIYVSLFLENGENTLNVYLEENAKVDFFGFFYNSCPENIIFHQKTNHTQLQCKAIFFDSWKNLSSHIFTQIDGENSMGNIYIISIVKENIISLNSNVSISQKSKKIEAKLDLENIFIWNSGKILSQPNLFISTQDVKVSHSSKTYRMDEWKIFYLQSRGLSQKESEKIILESYFKKTLSCIEMYDKKIFDHISGIFLDLNAVLKI